MIANASIPPLSNRRYDLDWIRTLVVLLVLPFHSLLVFVQNPGTVVYMKDTIDCSICNSVAGFIAVWQMQILFVIAGMSTAFALAKRSGGQYLRERVVRLLVPFLFGIATLVPAMTYITQIDQGKTLTFWQHYARFFTLSPDLSGRSGTFTPAHLWFILFLFLFSVIALPLFLLLRSDRSQGILRGMAWLFEKPVGIFLLGLPLIAAGRTNFLDAQNPIYYITVFITGYIMATDERYQKAIARDWPYMLTLGLILEVMRQTGLPGTASSPMAQSLWGLAMEANSWVWVLAILGAGQRFLNVGSPALRYLSEASYPFYILHLLVLTVVTFYAVRLPLGVLPKLLLINAVSFALTFALYEVTWRVEPLRFLLGMKTLGPRGLSARKDVLVRM